MNNEKNNGQSNVIYIKDKTILNFSIGLNYKNKYNK